MNFINQVMKSLPRNDVKQFFRLPFVRKNNRYQKWAFLLISGIGALLTVLLRYDGMQSLFKGTRGQHAKTKKHQPYQLNQLLTAEMAEEFFRKSTNESEHKREDS
jgi:hypothetical protein